MLEFPEPFSGQLTIKVYISLSSSLSTTTELSDGEFACIACIEGFVVLLYDATNSYLICGKNNSNFLLIQVFY